MGGGRRFDEEGHFECFHGVSSLKVESLGKLGDCG